MDRVASPVPSPRPAPSANAPRRSRALTRRAILAGAMAGVLAVRGAAASEIVGPEEVGLPKPGTPHTGEASSANAAVSIRAVTAPSTGRVPMGPVTVNGRRYLAYTDAAPKEGQWQMYTCEFDVAYIILKTYGIETDFGELVEIVTVDDRVEPYAVETAQGPFIYGGDIGKAFSGDFATNIYAKTRGSAIRRAFEHFGCGVREVKTRAEVEDALRHGELMWLKCTVDFGDYVPATWLTPENKTYPTVRDNDHCVAAIGFNEENVVVRDPLGPTSTNPARPYEYEVPWDIFLDRWRTSGYDGLIVTPPAGTA